MPFQNTHTKPAGSQAQTSLTEMSQARCGNERGLDQKLAVEHPGCVIHNTKSPAELYSGAKLLPVEAFDPGHPIGIRARNFGWTPEVKGSAIIRSYGPIPVAMCWWGANMKKIHCFWSLRMVGVL